MTIYLQIIEVPVRPLSVSFVNEVSTLEKSVTSTISLEISNVSEARKVVPIMAAVTSAVPKDIGSTILPLISKIFPFSFNRVFSWSVMSISSPLLSTAVTIIIACWYRKSFGLLYELLNRCLVLASTDSEPG